MDAALFDPFHYCALGHLHRGQTAGNPRLRYCGSPLKYSVSEAGQEKSVLSVKLNRTGEVAVEPVVFPPLRDLRTIRGTLEELLAPTAGEFASADYIQITVLTQGTEMGAAQKLRNVYPNYLQIHYQNPAAQALELEGRERLVRLSLTESYLAFYHQVTGQELSASGKAVLEALDRQMEQEREEENG